MCVCVCVCVCGAVLTAGASPRYVSLLACPLMRMLSSPFPAVRAEAGIAFSTLVRRCIVRCGTVVAVQLRRLWLLCNGTQVRMVPLDTPALPLPPGFGPELSAAREEGWRVLRSLLSPGAQVQLTAASLKLHASEPKPNIMLRNYQAEGVAWLRFLRDNGLHGVLADGECWCVSLFGVAVDATYCVCVCVRDQTWASGRPSRRFVSLLLAVHRQDHPSLYALPQCAGTGCSKPTSTFPVSSSHWPTLVHTGNSACARVCARMYWR